MSSMTVSMSMSSPIKGGRLLAAGIHLLVSLAVAAAAAGLVFLIWYPYPYREISGGRELFFIVMAVDVVMGPLLTLTVFNRNKPPGELRRDLTMIGVLQMAALVYGLWTVSVARPVHMVFEMDRFRVVHAIEVPEAELEQAPAGLQRLPWTGPTLLSTRPFLNDREKVDMTMLALGGVHLGARPALWQDYSQAGPQIRAAARPLGDLKTRFPAQAGMIDDALKSVPGAGTSAMSLGYLPMAGRDKYWTVLLDLNTTEVIAFVPIDSF
jgi:hypothetical protein